MAFIDTIKELPFQGTTPNGSGFFPPIFKGAQHIYYLLGCLAEEKMPVTDEEALEELRQAQAHWDARVTTPAVSTAITERANLIGRAIHEALAEWGNWDEQTRIVNIRDLAQRIAQNGADLDRELVGLRNSDPGTSL